MWKRASIPWTANAGLATPIWCIETPYWEWGTSLWLSELQKLSQAKPQSDWCWKYLVLQNTPDQLPLIEEAITIHWHYHGDAWTWTPPHAVSRHENCHMLKSSSSLWCNTLFGLKMDSKGLWLVIRVKWHPNRYGWNFLTPITRTRASFSVVSSFARWQSMFWKQRQLAGIYHNSSKDPERNRAPTC